MKVTTREYWHGPVNCLQAFATSSLARQMTDGDTSVAGRRHSMVRK